MNYCKRENKIYTTKEFLDPKSTLTCGQFFRFFSDEYGVYTVVSKDKAARISLLNNEVVIEPFNERDLDYFVSFFDLDSDYEKKISRLKSFVKEAFSSNEKALTFYSDSINEGRGIKILNQDLFEALISFIVSQNNNIPRIKGIIEKLCVKYGEPIVGTDLHSFPTAMALAEATDEDLKACGLGYRVPFVKQAAEKLKDTDELKQLSLLDTVSLRNELLKFNGIGNKVANCVLLFGFHRFDSFPVDTWIEKIYVEQTGETTSSRDNITLYFEDLFKEDAALMQQYIFYHMRNLNGINL